MVHDGLGVREKTIEAPVEDAGGYEGVDIADIETARDVSVAWVRLQPNVDRRQVPCEQVACCG